MAEPFFPHAFQTKLSLIKDILPPVILIEQEAYKDMLAIARLAGNDEIAWLGTVRKLNERRYLIDSIHMPPGLEVSASTSKFVPEKLAEYFSNIINTDQDIFERTLFWGHVHPGSATGASQQDEEQMELFSHNDYFIRGIFGRTGRAEFTFFDFKNNIRWNDVPWMIYLPETGNQEKQAKWEAEVAQKVTRIPPVPQDWWEEGENIDPRIISFLMRKLRINSKKGMKNGNSQY